MLLCNTTGAIYSPIQRCHIRHSEHGGGYRGFQSKRSPCGMVEEWMDPTVSSPCGRSLFSSHMPTVTLVRSSAIPSRKSLASDCFTTNKGHSDSHNPPTQISVLTPTSYPVPTLPLLCPNNHHP